MFKHLLIPLDGSSLAETVLPAAEYLAGKFDAWVTLVHVIEQNAPSEVHGEKHLTNAEEAEKYLAKVAADAFQPDVRVERHVHTSEVKDVAKSIARHVEEFATDLTILCAHGKSGLRDMLFGSIAQQVISFGSTPALIFRPVDDNSVADFSCGKILVALDGNQGHEEGLKVAVGLAQKCDIPIHLVMVVPTLGTISGSWTATSRITPGSTSRMLEIAVVEAADYLERQKTELVAKGIAVSADILRGDPATNITDAAREAEASVIILGTHGKIGMDAFWSGSITPKVFKRCRIPLLLVPVRE
ncbi:MAG TPA: universal stress protein [candidate division Zixibacteria bacterium]|nr:universal stress protein [candidate division Zixibacteria bacterium]